MKYSTRFISATKEYCEFLHFVPAPYLRKTFEVDFVPEKAEMLVTGLGFYEFWLNGEHLTKGCLAPYISNPNDLIYYDRYDLTDKLKKGKNVIAFALGNGLQNPIGGEVWDFQLARWRSAPKLALCFECSGEGKEISFEADESFKVHASPIYFDDMRCGERYDARNEIDGWNLPDFDDSEWNNAISVEAPSGECLEGGHALIKKIREIKPVKFYKGHISAIAHPRENLPKHILPEEEYCNDGYIYDFGENITGIVRLKIRGRKGQKIVMSCGESLFDGGLDMHNICEFQPIGMTQVQVYICNGEGEEIWEPMFCYHGFQYCFVTGIDDKQATEDLLTYVVMHADVPQIGGFDCSDELVNRLQDATLRSDLANMFYFPTDCPHREKNGWTGDAHLSAEQFMMNLGAENTLREWLHSVRKSQDERGALPGIVPTGGWGFEWGNGPAWDAALTYIPYFCYVLRGDRKIIEENATAIFRYCEYISRRRDERGLVAIGLGDWCPVTSVKSPLEFTDSVTCMSILKKAVYIFSELGLSLERDFCEKLYDELRTAVRRHLTDFGTMTAAGSCQTSQAMAIYYDVFTPGEKTAAFKKLLEIIKRRDDHVDAGILGMRVLFRVLSDFGEPDLAFKLITRPDYPSYGNFVERGLTALPEDFLREEDTPNSQNHHMYGDISAWFIEYIGGIRVNPFLTDPSEVEISPVFIEKLDGAEASYETVGGRVSVKWCRTNEGITLNISADKGVHGRIRLPDGYAFEDGRGSFEELYGGTFKIIRE